MGEGSGDGAMAGEGDVRFDPWNTPRPTPRGLDVATTLRHFALVTYAVEPAQIQAYVAPPFRPVTVETAAGPRAQEPGMALELPGFSDVETGLLYLTHALVGYYRRPDGRIGVNRVWHEKMEVQPARLVEGAFPLLHRLGFVGLEEQKAPHSVLVTPKVDFLSHIPPTTL